MLCITCIHCYEKLQSVSTDQLEELYDNHLGIYHKVSKLEERKMIVSRTTKVEVNLVSRLGSASPWYECGTHKCLVCSAQVHLGSLESHVTLAHRIAKNQYLVIFHLHESVFAIPDHECLVCGESIKHTLKNIKDHLLSQHIMNMADYYFKYIRDLVAIHRETLSDSNNNAVNVAVVPIHEQSLEEDEEGWEESRMDYVLSGEDRSGEFAVNVADVPIHEQSLEEDEEGCEESRMEYEDRSVVGKDEFLGERSLVREEEIVLGEVSSVREALSVGEDGKACEELIVAHLLGDEGEVDDCQDGGHPRTRADPPTDIASAPKRARLADMQEWDEITSEKQFEEEADVLPMEETRMDQATWPRYRCSCEA